MALALLVRSRNIAAANELFSFRLVSRNSLKEGAKMLFYKFYGTVAAKLFFLRSIFLELS